MKKRPARRKAEDVSRSTAEEKKAAVLQKIQQKLHHGLKVFRQALKKAKQFEVRKLCRRLQAEKEGEHAGKKECCSKKVEAKLAVLKALSLEDVAKRVCHELGFTPSGLPSEVPAGQPAAIVEGDLSDGVHREWAIARVKGAGCVHEHLEGLRSQLAAYKELKRAPLGGEDGAEVAEDGGGALHKDDYEGKELSMEDGPETDLPAMGGGKDARKQSRKPKAGISPLNKAKQLRVAGVKAPPSTKRGKLPKALKKPKNRLGQRERRRLAERQYGGFGDHQRGSSRPRWDVERGEGAPNARNAEHEHLGAKRKLEEGNGYGNGSGMKQARRIHGGSAETVARGIQDGGDGRGAAVKVSRPDFRNGASRHSAEKPSAEALHPSWAAKKAQQKKLVVASEGKKIKFDD